MVCEGGGVVVVGRGSVGWICLVCGCGLGALLRSSGPFWTPVVFFLGEVLLREKPTDDPRTPGNASPASSCCQTQTEQPPPHVRLLRLHPTRKSILISSNINLFPDYFGLCFASTMSVRPKSFQIVCVQAGPLSGLALK